METERAQQTRERIKVEESRARTRFLLTAFSLAAGVCLSMLLACSFGRMTIPAAGVIEAMLSGCGFGTPGLSDPTWKVIVCDIRLSRVVLSALVGGSLAVAGVAFQGILRNPLADPFTIGVSTGAAFGASLAIFLGLGGSALWGLELVPLASLGGALAALFTVIALARVSGRLRRDTMVLAGIVVATFLSALISLVKSLDEESVSSIVFWVMGSFQGRGWNHVVFALPYLAAGMLLIGFSTRELDILSLGDTQAKQLGVEVNRVRLRFLVGASLLTAGSVSVSGVIGFVGLVVPHLIRMLAGPQHGRLLVLSGLLGAMALTWSDVAARIVLSGGEELPVGVVTALMGGPFFCVLLKWKREASAFD
ncbi:MAG: iron ABC transporter permease [Thermodesulfobacteriota bacterium]